MNVEQIWWTQSPSVHKPPTNNLQNLRTRGQFFELEDGTHWTAIQCSDFNLLARYLTNEDIRPVLQQRMDCGFNLLRVWTLFNIDKIGTLTSLDYTRVPAFVSLCGSYGLYVEFTAYTGINDPKHWVNLCNAALLCHPKPILELVNELDQNENEPDPQGRVFNLSLHAQPDGLVTAHGSNGSEHQPVLPHWSYAEMHFNDASEWQRKTGHNSWEVWSGPTLANENTRYADHTQSEINALDAAESAALLCAGSCFHSVRGKTSELWDGVEETCARQWANGARKVDLRYQDGRYNRPDELKNPEDLRVYQRILPDGSAYTVHIRK